MARWNRALVTGASSGIGAAMAQQLADEGTELVVVARDAARLEALAARLDVAVEVLSADLADPDQLAAVLDRVADQSSPIDLLVNNAGLGFTGDLVEMPADNRRLIIAVNVLALHELCAVGGHAMRQRGHGTILNVSSIAGDVPGPQSATYNASKAFVTSLTQSLHMELQPHGVHVGCLCPGLTRTEFQERAEYDASDLPDVLWQSADAVARIGLDAIAKGRVVTTSGALNSVASKLARTAPRVVSRWSAKALSQK